MVVKALLVKGLAYMVVEALESLVQGKAPELSFPGKVQVTWAQGKAQAPWVQGKEQDASLQLQDLMIREQH